MIHPLLDASTLKLEGLDRRFGGRRTLTGSQGGGGARIRDRVSRSATEGTAIRDTRTGAVLFLGRVVDPSA